jgi:hypothetical protein
MRTSGRSGRSADPRLGKTYPDGAVSADRFGRLAVRRRARGALPVNAKATDPAGGLDAFARAANQTAGSGTASRSSNSTDRSPDALGERRCARDVVPVRVCIPRVRRRGERRDPPLRSRARPSCGISGFSDTQRGERAARNGQRRQMHADHALRLIVLQHDVLRRQPIPHSSCSRERQALKTSRDSAARAGVRRRRAGLKTPPGAPPDLTKACLDSQRD